MQHRFINVVESAHSHHISQRAKTLIDCMLPELVVDSKCFVNQAQELVKAAIDAAAKIAELDKSHSDKKVAARKQQIE